MPRKALAAVQVKSEAKSKSAENESTSTFVDGLQDAVIESIPVDNIDASDVTFQYRFTTDTNGLRDAIAREGQLEPIDLTDSNPHLVIDGFRRLAAIRELGWPAVRAIIRRDVSIESAHQIAFEKNVVRKNLRPIEKANAIRLAKTRGCRPTAIAQQFGMSEKQIRRYDALLALPRHIQDLVDEGHITMAHAAVLAKFDGINAVEWVDKVRQSNCSASDLRRELHKHLKPLHHRRQKVFIRSTAGEVRGYAWRLTRDSSAQELDGAIEAHKRALNALVALRRDKSTTPPPRETPTRHNHTQRHDSKLRTSRRG
jgi:ParB family chromosome partitioning protein